MAYNIDTDRLIDVVEKEVVHPILKYKCAKAFQVGYKKGLQCAQKPRFLVKETGDIILIPFGMRWIPVTERLPKYHKAVLTRSKMGTNGHLFLVAELMVVDGEIGWGCGDGFEPQDLIEITHWMPLPEPPKELDPADGR